MAHFLKKKKKKITNKSPFQQVGKGPYASEVSGIIKIGQTMTMVLGVKDDENKFDMMVRLIVSHFGRTRLVLFIILT